ncbi:MAG TPA: VOC family protein [Actinomycetota bacterium]|nr:VOC family protein [Actinomycetota bacterium]
MLELDHVIVAVRDLDAAAARFEDDYGLTALAGGRHRGLGTGNRIVPLGNAYIELMAVVDESEPSPLAHWVTRTAAAGDRLGALCLRTDDIDGVAARLGETPLEMVRTRPDGVTLRWKLAGLEQMLATPGMPFFIQWYVEPGEFPGRAPVSHRSGATGIAWVEIAGDEAALAERLGGPGLGVRVVPGEPGVRAVGVATPGGEIVIR